MIWLLALVGGLALAYLLAEPRRRPMGRAARNAMPGHLADLPAGQTHYRWEGPRDGPVAVVIHGISTGAYIMDGVAALMARMGYRVLRYDLYGRGFSDRPAGAQDRAFFLGQLRALLDHLQIKGEITLVGFSMGGAIATAFAAEEPHRVDRLVLLASAGLGQETPGLAALARDLPVIGDWMMRVTGGWEVRRMAREVGQAQGLPDDLIEAQIEETFYRGFMPSILSSLRHILREDMAPAHRKIAGTDIPVLAIWAGQDEVIPLSAPGRLAEINRRAMQTSIPQATHALPVTHTTEIREAMQAFLRDM